MLTVAWSLGGGRGAGVVTVGRVGGVASGGVQGVVALLGAKLVGHGLVVAGLHVEKLVTLGSAVVGRDAVVVVKDRLHLGVDNLMQGVSVVEARAVLGVGEGHEGREHDHALHVCWFEEIW